ncbi:MAG TPA: winged helix-turn-helix domain-containing protein, partial [Thermoanaerobaculia bacterium]|nr:winged helix-turn-helix domain-containing protein [Thermoanaerobaculia bacterium]
MTAGRHFDFGPFRLDAANHELLRDGRAVPLKPKAFDLLRVLVENRGRIVSKDDLLRRVWPDAAVEESSLTQNVYELRKALSGADRDLRYIENVPKRGYRFAAEVSASAETASADSLSASGGDQKSIAVLPFRSLGATAGSEYLGVGIADTLITVLTNIRGIVVRPIAAGHAYANGPTDPLQLARTLGVDAVLDGSVQTASGRIRVTVRLVDVASGAALWAMKFDETEADIFAVQDTIAETLAAAVAPELGDRDRAALKKRYTASTAAYELYLKGRYNWKKSSEESLWRAIEFFRAAIEVDPHYALAYVGIADAYTSLDWYGVLSTRESNPHALRAAERALAIDGSLAEAHASLAMAKQYAWEWAAAERAYGAAIALNPNYAQARQWYGVYLAFMGRVDEAIAEIRRAESLDPVSLSIGSQVALVYLCARRYEEGLAQARKVLAVDSSALEARFYLGMLLQLLGRADEAIAVYRELPSDNPDFRAMLASAYGTAGDLAAA